jgi:hypothetical protein
MFNLGMPTRVGLGSTAPVNTSVGISQGVLAGHLEIGAISSITD